MPSTPEATDTIIGYVLNHLPKVDFDGDGITDVTVWRPSSEIWHVIRSFDAGIAQTS